MRILNKHITVSFLTTFAATLVVLTFVLSIGGIFKITDLLARGVPWRPILAIFFNGMPAALSFAIPMSALTSALLVFGRLSADGETSAMKACGISMWQIALPPLIVALGLSAVCLYINSELAPRSHLAQRSAIKRLGMETPLDLIEEGRFIQDFEGLTLYIGRRKGAQLTNIRIYDLRKPGLRREIRAKSGVLHTSRKGDLTLELRDVRVEPFLEDRPGAAYCQRWMVTIPNAMENQKYRKKECDFDSRDVIDGIAHTRQHYPNLSEDDLARQRMALIVELNQRIVLAVSCFAFVWLGIPLGTRTHRKESSIGVGISLFLVGNFYLFVIVADSLARYPQTCPYLVVWMPVSISLLLGWLLMRRSN